MFRLTPHDGLRSVPLNALIAMAKKDGPTETAALPTLRAECRFIAT
jgi:hypothetical protein